MVLEMNEGAKRANDKAWQQSVIWRQDRIIAQNKRLTELIERMLIALGSFEIEDIAMPEVDDAE